MYKEMHIFIICNVCVFVFKVMKLDKLVWSKAKADILKYLVFRRQWISIRAFEAELERSFPAIKKQIDQLEDAGVVAIDKDNTKWWSISLTPGLGQYIRQLLLYMIQVDLEEYFRSHELLLKKWYYWHMFWAQVEVDLVLIYEPLAVEHLPKIKEDIDRLFDTYLIRSDQNKLVLLSSSEFDKRYRLADKFVLQLMRECATGTKPTEK
jgi:biotin operon repressor